MRVIHVIPSVNAEASGPTYVVMRLCQGQIDLQHTVNLTVRDDATGRSQPPFVKSFPLGIGSRRLGRSRPWYRWLHDECLSGRATALHNHGMWQMNAVYPAWAIRGSRTVLIQSVHGAFTEWAMKWGSVAKPAFWRLLQRPAMQRVHCFHATAQSEVVDIRRLGFRQPIALIPFGIDIPAVVAKQPKAERVLLFLGRLHPNKGLDLLIPAWRSLQAEFPAWRLRIVGPDEGGHRAQMEELATGLRAERISFDGPVYGDAKATAYRQADLFVLPSYSENFGVSVAEALAVGTPVVVSKGAPWSNLVRERAGWWVDQGIEPLTAGLRQAMGLTADALAEMGHRGRAWMERDFSWQDIAGRMLQTYDWVLNGSTRPDWVVVD